MDSASTGWSRVWQLLFYGGAAGDAKTRDQVYVINVYSVLGFLALLVFGLLHIFVEGNAALGELEVASSIIILLNAVGLRLTHHVVLAKTFFILTILVVLFVMLTTGGTRGTGIFWVFVSPSLMFFLAGKRQGLWWMGALYGMILTVLALAELSIIHTPYTLIDIRQLLVSLAVVTIGVYIYQNSRERALRQIQESRQDLQEYLDHMTTFCVKVGLDGRVSFANKIAKEVSGLGEHMLGTKFIEGSWWSFDKSVQRRVEAAFYKVLTGESVNYDEQMKVATANGPLILTVSFSMIPIFENKKIKYVLAEARDISAEQAVDRAKSEFVALASHQLRTPVSAIAGFAERLLSGDAGQLTPKQHQNVKQMYQSNQRLGALINDMLMVANLDLQNVSVTSVPTDIRQLAKTIIQEVTAVHLHGRALQIGEDFAKDLPMLSVDPSIVRTILRNLLSNAVKYTPDAGHVNLRIATSDQKLSPDSRGSLQLEVQDSGFGIPKDVQDKLFTKFFRGWNIQDKDTDGTGLGLYIVKSLLDYVGGRITFTSKENAGTIFTVLLPLEGMRTTDGGERPPSISQ